MCHVHDYWTNSDFIWYLQLTYIARDGKGTIVCSTLPTYLGDAVEL